MTEVGRMGATARATERRIEMIIVVMVVAVLATLIVAVLVKFDQSSELPNGEDSMDHIVAG